jgi:hypothetical protein
MKNHVHLFVFDTRQSISQFMNHLHGRYAQYFNRACGRTGHLFGDRYKNKIVQVNKYGLWLSRYIHRQALEQGLVKKPTDYPWTSYRAYVGLDSSGILKPGVILEQFGRGRIARQRYEEFVCEGETARRNEEGGRTILGDADFIQTVGSASGCIRPAIADEDGMLDAVYTRFKTSCKLLGNPRGIRERRLRHEVFVFLSVTYRISASRIGSMLNVSSAAVSKVLRAKSGEKAKV